MSASKEVVNGDSANMDTSESATMDTDVSVKSSVGWEGISDCSSIEVISEPGETVSNVSLDMDEFVQLKADSDTSVEDIVSNPQIYITEEYRDSLNVNFEAFKNLSVSSNHCINCNGSKCVCRNGDSPGTDSIDLHTLSGSKEDRS